MCCDATGRIFAGGEGGESLLSCLLSILGWGRQLVEVWWMAPLGAGFACTDLIPQDCFLQPCCRGGMCGGCEVVNVFVPVMAAAIPWSLLMIFEALRPECSPGLLGWRPGWPSLALVYLGFPEDCWTPPDACQTVEVGGWLEDSI